eukprot:1120308-Rhodomonas_salina.1
MVGARRKIVSVPDLEAIAVAAAAHVQHAPLLHVEQHHATPALQLTSVPPVHEMRRRQSMKRIAASP